MPLDLPLLTSDPGDPAWARERLARAMRRGAIPELTWTPVAGLPARTVTAEGLHTLPDAAAWTAWACSTRELRGAELDLLVSFDDALAPLTVQIALDGSQHLSRGTRVPAPVGTRADLEAWRTELAARHRLSGVVDGDRSWTAEELDVVSVALELLDPRERAWLTGSVLSRDAASPRSPRELALYDPLGDPVVIHLYDGAFEAGSWSFVGTVDAPRHAAVMTLVHEFGHVVSDAPLSDAWSRWVAALEAHAASGDPATTGPELRLARRQRQRVGRRGPVIRSYAELRPGRLTPTTWSTDVFESFAEAFALYHTDPDALLRAAPEQHAWFAAGGHLAWSRFPE